MSCDNESCLMDSGESSRFPVSIFVENQLPKWVADDHPKFIAFIEAYYEWMELPDNAYAAKYCLSNNLDVDSTVDQFLEFFKKEYLLNIPEELYEKNECQTVEFDTEDGVYDYVLELPVNENSEITVVVDGDELPSDQYSVRAGCGSNSRILFDSEQFNPFPDATRHIEVTVCEDIRVNTRLLIKTIKQLNASKGTPNSFKLMFKLLFNEDVEIEYPSEKLLKPSDGKWVKDSNTELTNHILFEAQGVVVNKYPIRGSFDDIQSVTINSTPTTNYTVEDGYIVVPSAGEGDFVEVFYFNAGNAIYGTTESFAVVDNSHVFVTATNITPAPTQTDVRIIRYRGGIPTAVGNTQYTLVELPDINGDFKTAFIINPFFDLQIGLDTVTFEVKSNLLDISGNVVGESWTVTESTNLDYNLGLMFDVSKASPVLTINGNIVNRDTLIEDFTNINTNTITLATTITGFGVGQFGITKNNNFLSRTEFTVDVNNNQIIFDTALIPTDEITVTICPAYYLEARLSGDKQTLFCVIDSVMGLTFDGEGGSDDLDLSYKTRPINGYFKNDDGKLSSTMVLQDSYKYQQFSYILKSEHTTDQYGDYLKALLHPAGYIMFGEILLMDCISWIIRDYKYIIDVDDKEVFSSSNDFNNGANSLGPRWRSFDINKFQYGLTSQGLTDTQIMDVADVIIGEPVLYPDKGIDLLMNSYINSFPTFAEMPPLFIGGLLTPL